MLSSSWEEINHLAQHCKQNDRKERRFGGWSPASNCVLLTVKTMKRSNEGMWRYVSRRERMWKHMYVRKAERETGGKRQVDRVGGRQIKSEDSCRRPLSD